MYGSRSVPSSRPSSDAESTIRELTQDFCTAFNTANYDQAAALFTSDALFMPSHRETSQGAKVIERVLRELGDAGYQNLRLETTRVDHSGDMAVETGRYNITIQRGSGTVVDRGKYMRGWRRLGAWRISADCWSTNLPLSDDLWVGGTKVA